MARSRGNKKKSLNKASQGGAIWRSYLDQEVVDLRAEYASKEKKVQKRNRVLADLHADIIRDINPSAQSLSKGQVPDIREASSEQYKAKGVQAAPFESGKYSLVESSLEALSKEELFKELSALDEYDLEIQKVLADKALQVFEEDQEIDTGTQDSGSGLDIPPEHESEGKEISLIPSSRRSFTIPKQEKKEEPAAKIQPKNTEAISKKSRQAVLAESKPSKAPKRPKPKKAQSSIKIKPPKRKRNRRKNNIVKKAAVFTVSASIVFFGIGGFFIYTKAGDIQGEAEARAMNAYSYMKEGKQALLELDPKRAEENFLKARDEFRSIEKEFAFLGKDVLHLAAQFPIQSKAGSVAYLIEAGDLFSQSGYEASLALGLIQKSDPLDKDKDTANSYVTDNLIQASFHLQKAQTYINEANTQLSYVRPEDIPAEFQKDIHAVQSETNKIEELFDQAFSSMDILLSFMGHREPRQYLLAFQNSTELRATGGFMGSYGLVTFDKGNIDDIFIDGIYNPDGQLKVKEFFVVPPKPLRYVTPHWGTRDANWFLNFPTSAEKIMWFYKQTGGADTDGVIAMTPLVVEKLLDSTGPIDMPEYGVTLDSGNFLELVQQEVEEDYDKELNRPKKIIADLTPILFKKLAETDEKIKLFNILHESLERKDILVYSRDTDVQEFISSRNWGGKINDGASGPNIISDYLSVNISNIGGWKTDKYTDTEIDSVTVINNKGEVIRTLLISRKHNGGDTPYKWYNKTNSAYIRIYTPKGSELISAEGFSEEPSYLEIGEGYQEDPDIARIEKTQWEHASGTDVFEETGKTVFGNWLHLGSGERKLIKLTYKLPFTASKDLSGYSLTVQKQSGLDAAYSGSVEELHENISFDYCEIEHQNGDTENFLQDFSFVQEHDAAITCKF